MGLEKNQIAMILALFRRATPFYHRTPCSFPPAAQSETYLLWQLSRVPAELTWAYDVREDGILLKYTCMHAHVTCHVTYHCFRKSPEVRTNIISFFDFGAIDIFDSATCFQAT